MKCLTGLAVVFVSTVACTTPPFSTPPDFVNVARVSLSTIEHGSARYVIVAPKELDPQARSALVALGRTVVAPEEVPYSALDSLPTGYLYLNQFTVREESATFEVTLGPVMRPRKNILGHCGSRTKIPLHHVSGSWAVDAITSTVC